MVKTVPNIFNLDFLIFKHFCISVSISYEAKSNIESITETNHQSSTENLLALADTFLASMKSIDEIVTENTSAPVSNESYIESKTESSSMKSQDVSVHMEEDVRIISEYTLKKKDPLFRLPKRIPRKRNTRQVSYKE